jgi:hypothetical protein
MKFETAILCQPSLWLAFQISLQVGECIDLRLHARIDHRIHKPGKPFGLEIQDEGQACRTANRFKLICASRPGWSGNDFEFNRFIRFAFSNFVITIDAPATWTFHALFEYRPDSIWLPRDTLNIGYRRSPVWIIHPVQNEIEDRMDGSLNSNTSFCVSHATLPFLVKRLHNRMDYKTTNSCALVFPNGIVSSY